MVAVPVVAKGALASGALPEAGRAWSSARPGQALPRSRPARGRQVASLARAAVLGGAAFGAGVLMQATTGLVGGGPAVSGTGGSHAVGRAAAARVWVVRPGDTLWRIAEAASLPGSDVRPLVYRLAAETGGRPLYPGERVQVP